MELNNLIDFCFDRRENKYITAFSYGALICLFSASLFANLFLRIYKSKWITEIKKNDLIKETL